MPRHPEFCVGDLAEAKSFVSRASGGTGAGKTRTPMKVNGTRKARSRAFEISVVLSLDMMVGVEFHQDPRPQIMDWTPTPPVSREEEMLQCLVARFSGLTLAELPPLFQRALPAPPLATPVRSAAPAILPFLSPIATVQPVAGPSQAPSSSAKQPRRN